MAPNRSLIATAVVSTVVAAVVIYLGYRTFREVVVGKKYKGQRQPSYHTINPSLTSLLLSNHDNGQWCLFLADREAGKERTAHVSCRTLGTSTSVRGISFVRSVRAVLNLQR